MSFFLPIILLTAFYLCCLYLNAMETTFIMEANTANPDQTVHKGAVSSRIILFAV